MGGGYTFNIEILKASYCKTFFMGGFLQSGLINCAGTWAPQEGVKLLIKMYAVDKMCFSFLMHHSGFALWC